MTTKYFEQTGQWASEETVAGEVVNFELDIIEVGAAFHGKMYVLQDRHGVGYQAKTAEELTSDFELFKSGIIKLKNLIAEGIDRNIPAGKRITLKEARIMAGVHPVILAEQIGITPEYLKRLENGEAKQGLKWEQVMNHYRATYLPGMKMDFIDWSMEQQKNLSHSAKSEKGC